MQSAWPEQELAKVKRVVNLQIEKPEIILWFTAEDENS
jgi:hypothetical protein